MIHKKVNGKVYNDLGYYSVPCGQCFACRINKTSQWTFRLMLELTDWDDACFITLTYDDENLGNPSLDFEDLKLFWKRLRKAIQPKKIRYYACGEYGDTHGRKHFHAIIFGLPCNDSTRLLISRTWTFCSPERFLYHGKGVAPVNIDDIAYVAGYCQKKLTGELGKEAYLDKGLIPPASRSSRYLGLKAFERNLDQVRQYGCVFWNGSQMPIPRYFRDKFNIVLQYDDESIKERAKFVYGKDYDENLLSYYRKMDVLGYLSDEVAKKLSTTSEQRKLNHLIAARQKKAQINAIRLANGKERIE